MSITTLPFDLDESALELLFDSLDSLRVGMTIFNSDDELVFANQHIRFIFPSLQEKEDLPGITFEHFCKHQIENGDIGGRAVIDDAEGWIYSWRTERRLREASPRTLRLSDGRWIEVKDRPTARGAVISFYSDVTELMQTKLRLEDAVAISADGFGFWDQKGRLVAHNEFFAEVLTGRKRGLQPRIAYKDVMRRWEADIVRRRDLDEAPETERSLVARAELVHLKNARAFHITERRTRDGGTMTIVTEVTAQQDREQALQKRGLYLRDTFFMLKQSQIRLEEQTREMLQMTNDLARAQVEAEKAETVRHSLLRNMSHELRTPLNAIIGFSEILSNELHGPLGSETYSEYVSMIHESGLSLLRLVNQVLEMSQIQAGTLEISPEAEDLGAVIEECLSDQRNEARKRSITLDYGEPQSEVPVLIDAGALQTAVNNVLSNALKYTDTGSKIIITLSVQATQATIGIRDFGPGIPDQVINEIEQPFNRGEDVYTARQNGAGLGLPIAHTLIALQGGTLTFQRPADGGTLALITLPLAAGEAEDAPEKTLRVVGSA